MSMKRPEIKSIATTLIASAILSACNGKDSGGSTPPVNPPVAGPGEGNQGSDATSCLVGETKRDDGSCVADCRVATDGKEYCLRLNEMPSDLDPTQKAAACEFGIFDRNECKKLTLSVGRGSVALLAGDTPRIKYDGTTLALDRIQLGVYEGFGNRVEYSYPTEYPSAWLKQKAFGNTSVQFATLGVAVDTEISARTFAENPLSRAGIDLFGVRFEMGPMSKDSFVALCGKLQALDDIEAAIRDEFHFAEIEAHKIFACGKSKLIVPPSITLECEGSDCSITEVDISWWPITENG